MGFDKVKCYICQAEFPDKETVIKHIKRKHNDHLSTRAFKLFVNQDESVTNKYQTQMDVTKNVANEQLNNQVDSDEVAKTTKEISEANAIAKSKEAKEREVLPKSSSKSTSTVDSERKKVNKVANDVSEQLTSQSDDAKEDNKKSNTVKDGNE